MATSRLTVQDAHFRLLGPFEITVNEKPVPLIGIRQQKLLALLLLNNGRMIPTESIVDALWDEPPRSARQQIHNAISRVRQTIGAVASNVQLITGPVGYRVDVPPKFVDVHRSQELTNAAEAACENGDLDKGESLLAESLQLWHGPALAGFEGRYFDAVSVELRERRIHTVERHIEIRLKQGDADSLISQLTGLVAEHPLRESLRHSLMLAQYRAGRTSEALLVFDEGRKLMAEELGLDPHPRLRKLQAAILRGDTDKSPHESDTVAPHAVALPAAEANPAMSTVDRNFLPYDINGFTGRTTEIDQLMEYSNRDAPGAIVISAINGMGGVGKTTFAIHLAHRVSQRYPDGQYFVDLHGHSVGSEPLSSSAALENLLTQAGAPVETIPIGLEQRSALWRSYVADRRVLILVDNAVDEAQVRPLIPGSSESVVLVTSRRKLSALEGTHALTLDALSVEEAVALFTHIVGDNRMELDTASTVEVVELCGRLPLAIHIAAARFRDRASWGIRHLLGQLRNQRTRTRFLTVGDRSVSDTLALSYRHLNDTERRVFRALGLCSGVHFGASAVAALVDLPIEDAELALEALYDKSLLLQMSPGRYEFHDLVKDCAKELAEKEDGAPERAALTIRLMNYYLELTNHWCQPIAVGPFRYDLNISESSQTFPEPLDERERMALLRSELPNIVAAIHLAAEAEQPGYAWRLVCALMPYLSRSNFGGQSLELCELALESARRAGDLDGQALSLFAVAAVHRQRGQATAAIQLLEDATSICAGLGNQRWIAFIAASLGTTQYNNGQLDSAYETFRTAHQSARLGNDRKARATLANNLGVACRDLGRFEESSHYLQEFAKYTSFTSPRAKITHLLNTGILHQLQFRFDDAYTDFSSALDLAKDTDDRRDIATVQECLAEVLRAMGRFLEAIELSREALKSARSLSLQEVEGEALNNLADIHLSVGELDRAEMVYNELRKAGSVYGLPKYLARAQDGLAHVHFRRGQVDDARRSWSKAIDLHPDGSVDARNARVHLDRMEAECIRCVVVSSSRNAEVL